MSRTRRRDKEGHVFWDGRLTSDINYRCRCEFCVNTDREKIREKIAEQEIKEGLEYVYGNGHLKQIKLYRDYNKMPDSSASLDAWDLWEEEHLQEQKNWEDYKAA